MPFGCSYWCPAPRWARAFVLSPVGWSPDPRLPRRDPLAPAGRLPRAGPGYPHRWPRPAPAPIGKVGRDGQGAGTGWSLPRSGGLREPRKAAGLCGLDPGGAGLGGRTALRVVRGGSFPSTVCPRAGGSPLQDGVCGVGAPVPSLLPRPQGAVAAAVTPRARDPLTGACRHRGLRPPGRFPGTDIYHRAIGLPCERHCPGVGPAPTSLHCWGCRRVPGGLTPSTAVCPWLPRDGAGPAFGAAQQSHRHRQRRAETR